MFQSCFPTVCYLQLSNYFVLLFTLHTLFFSFFNFDLFREKLKKKLEESGGLTFQIPQFNTEYGTRRVPAVKKIKVLKEGKVLKVKVAKDKKEKEKEKGLRKKLTSKMVQDSLDLLLSGSGVLSPQGMDRVAAPRSPPGGKYRGSAYSAIKKGSAEKVKPKHMNASPSVFSNLTPKIQFISISVLLMMFIMFMMLALLDLPPPPPLNNPILH